MIDAARAKAAAAGVTSRFSVGDAGAPPVQAGSVDVVLVRHVLWAFEEPGDVLASWIDLLAPGGRLLLVEGRWSTGAGLTAADCEALVRRHRHEAQVRMLREPSYWGKEITDERYLLVSSR
jgi:SAM-dependent methyltransferase